MIGFALIATIQSAAAIFVAYEAVKLKPDDPWSHIKVEKDKKISIQDNN